MIKKFDRKIKVLYKYCKLKTHKYKLVKILNL